MRPQVQQSGEGGPSAYTPVKVSKAHALSQDHTASHIIKTVENVKYCISGLRFPVRHVRKLGSCLSHPQNNKECRAKRKSTTLLRSIRELRPQNKTLPPAKLERPQVDTENHNSPEQNHGSRNLCGTQCRVEKATRHRVVSGGSVQTRSRGKTPGSSHPS